jgi:hypothetical protein
MTGWGSEDPPAFSDGQGDPDSLLFHGNVGSPVILLVTGLSGTIPRSSTASCSSFRTKKTARVSGEIGGDKKKKRVHE